MGSLADSKRKIEKMFSVVFDTYIELYEKQNKMNQKGFYMHNCDEDCSDNCDLDGEYVHATTTVKPMDYLP